MQETNYISPAPQGSGSVSPDDLIGRTVSFRWESYANKPKTLHGKVIQTGRAPGTVIIESEAIKVKPLREGRIRKSDFWDNHPPTRSLHCRPVSEIEVLA